MDTDDLEPRKPPAFEIGGDLSTLSVEELEDLIERLTAEIDRIRIEITAKNATRAAADSVFKS